MKPTQSEILDSQKRVQQWFAADGTTHRMDGDGFAVG